MDASDLCALPLSYTRLLMSLRKELVYTSDALTYMSAAQRTHTFIALVTSGGLGFMGSTGH